MAFELFLNPWALLPVLFSLLYAVYSNISKPRNAFGSIPWVGLAPTKFFAQTRATFSSRKAATELKEAWDQVWTSGHRSLPPTLY